MIDSVLCDVLSRFMLDAEAVSCEPYGCGHINATYCAVTASGRRYILQRLSEAAFHDIPGMMNNITLVTEFLRQNAADSRSVLTLIPTRDGANWIHCDSGYWRVYDFVEGSLCLQAPETDNDFYESAVGFGTFQQQLAEFPVEKLIEVIPNFHNTPDRYRIFHETLARDPLGRAAGVQKEIDFYLAHEEEMGMLQRMRENGELPTRVTHNDTKLNNVLLDEKTRKALCVIDLDTTMPGLSLYDFGDSIRFGAATAPEDERDLDKLTVDLSRYEIFTRGFVRACPGLTPLEVELLPMGAKTMTLECGLRFLTDYIDGDHYFAVHRESHNLDRTRTQIRLVQETEAKWQQINAIIRAVHSNKQ